MLDDLLGEAHHLRLIAKSRAKPVLGRNPALHWIEIADATAPEIGFVHIINDCAQRGIGGCSN